VHHVKSFWIISFLSAVSYLSHSDYIFFRFIACLAHFS
jgi:hypothetical protein